MRVLHKEGPYCLGIYEEREDQVRNYVVYDERKDKTNTDKNGVVTIRHKYAYHSKMHQALSDLSRRRGDEVTSDLSKWIGELREATGRLQSLCLGM